MLGKVSVLLSTWGGIVSRIEKMKSGQEIKSGQPKYFHLKNKLIWDWPLLPTNIDFLIITIYIQQIAERYKTYILQIGEKSNKINRIKWLVVSSSITGVEGLVSYYRWKNCLSSSFATCNLRALSSVGSSYFYQLQLYLMSNEWPCWSSIASAHSAINVGLCQWAWQRHAMFKAVPCHGSLGGRESGGYATLAYALRFEDWAFGQVWMNVDPDHFTTKIRMRLGSRTRVFWRGRTNTNACCTIQAHKHRWQGGWCTDRGVEQDLAGGQVQWHTNEGANVNNCVTCFRWHNTLPKKHRTCVHTRMHSHNRVSCEVHCLAKLKASMQELDV